MGECIIARMASEQYEAHIARKYDQDRAVWLGLWGPAYRYRSSSYATSRTDRSVVSHPRRVNARGWQNISTVRPALEGGYLLRVRP